MNPGHQSTEDKIGYLQEQMLSQNNEIVEKNEEHLCEEDDLDNDSTEDQNYDNSDPDEAQNENCTSNFKVSGTH